MLVWTIIAAIVAVAYLTLLAALSFLLWQNLFTPYILSVLLRSAVVAGVVIGSIMMYYDWDRFLETVE